MPGPEAEFAVDPALRNQSPNPGRRKPHTQLVTMPPFDKLPKWLQTLLNRSPDAAHPSSSSAQTDTPNHRSARVGPFEPFESWEDDPIAPGKRRLRRPLVYMFEHVALPRAFFSNHPEVEKSLAMEDPRGFPFLMHIWSKAIVECDGRFWPEEATYGPGMSDYREVVQNDVAATRFAARGMDIWIVRAPPPLVQGEAHFVAMCRRSGVEHAYMRSSPDSRYFTLERGATADGPVFFCEWTMSGEHRNFGDKPQAGMDAKRFLKLVESRL